MSRKIVYYNVSSPGINSDFVSTWDTTQAGSASDTVVLPLLSGGTYSGTIDWGDGNTSALSYANRSHTYAAGGIYTITISGTTLQGWTFQNAGDKAKITEISNWGLFDFTETRTFQGCTNMDITATDVPNISGTDFTSNFYNADGITTVQDWSGWNMSGVTNYTNCFAENGSFNGNLDNWVHSSVTSVSKMFLNATSFNSDLDTWDVSGVTTWTEFARGATSFNGDVSNWTPSGAMTSAFLSCSAFTGIGCSTWDTSGVTSMYALFSQCVLFNADISSWDTSAVTDMTSMLRNCDTFDRNIGSWDIDQVTVFTNFMTDATGLSTANYDALLVGWEANLQTAYPGGVGYPSTININFGGSQYTSAGAGGTARASLVSTFGWTITDGGGV
jgi:surface protein